MRGLHSFAPGLMLGLISAATSTAQEQSIVTRTRLVTVNVIVTDKSGRYIHGLSQNDFLVFDEKIRQEIAHFSAEPAPVSIGIVYEINPRREHRTSAMLASLRQFTRNLRPDDDFFFAAFGPQGSVSSDFVPTEAQMVDYLSAVKPGGTSSLYDAVYLAAGRLRKTRNLKKALLVVSTGEDDKSSTNYKTLINRLREFDVQIYAIGMASPAIERTAGQNRWIFEDVTRQIMGRSRSANAEASMGGVVLTEMARISGGTAYYPETENEPELEGTCAQIARELRQQYTIGFYPAGSSSNRTWHRLKIKINPASGRSGLSLSYRRGYRLNGEERTETVNLAW